MPNKSVIPPAKKKGSTRTGLSIETRKGEFREEFGPSEVEPKEMQALLNRTGRFRQGDRKQGGQEIPPRQTRKSRQEEIDAEDFTSVDSDDHAMRGDDTLTHLSGPDGHRARKMYSGGREEYEDEDYFGEPDPRVPFKKVKSKTKSSPPKKKARSR